MISVILEQRHDGVRGASCKPAWRRSSLGRGDAREDHGPKAAWSTPRTVRRPELLRTVSKGEDMVKDEVRGRTKAGGGVGLLIFRVEGKPLRALHRRMLGPDLF